MDYQDIEKKISESFTEQQLFDVRADICKYRAEVQDEEKYRKLRRKYENQSIKVAKGKTHTRLNY